MEITAREIKFRAWDKKEKYMETHRIFISYLNGGIKVDGCAYPLSNGWVHGNINREVRGMENIEPDVILLQYTGLKDKNDKEIYEGDILCFISTIGEKHIHAVIWSKFNGSWHLKPITSIPVSAWSDYFEVIGNIYENPELSNGNKEAKDGD
jgi:uncharacterized phage protein (TIGR01671 family)